MQLTFAGIELPTKPSAEEIHEEQGLLREAVASGDQHKSPGPRECAVFVWKDAGGRYFVVVADERGTPIALPFRIGRQINVSDSYDNGGFISADQISGAGTHGQRLSGPLGSESHRALNPEDTSPTIWKSAYGETQSTDRISQHGDQSSNTRGQESNKRDRFESMLRNRIVGKVNELAGSALVSALGGPSMADALGDMLSDKGLAEMGLGALSTAGTEVLFGELWAISDGSSVGEQLAYKYSKELAGKVMSEMQQGLLNELFSSTPSTPKPGTPFDGFDEWSEMLFGISAPAGYPAARVNDPTDHSGARIVSGAVRTQIVGSMAARISDKQVCPKVEPGPIPHLGGPIAQGLTTVEIEGLAATRENHVALCSGCGLPAMLKPNQSTVRFGGPSTPAPVIERKHPPHGNNSTANKTNSAGSATPTSKAAPVSKAEGDSSSRKPVDEHGEQKLRDLAREQASIGRAKQELNDQLASGKISDEEYRDRMEALKPREAANENGYAQLTRDYEFPADRLDSDRYPIAKAEPTASDHSSAGAPGAIDNDQRSTHAPEPTVPGSVPPANEELPKKDDPDRDAKIGVNSDGLFVETTKEIGKETIPLEIFGRKAGELEYKATINTSAGDGKVSASVDPGFVYRSPNGKDTIGGGAKGSISWSGGRPNLSIEAGGFISTRMDGVDIEVSGTVHTPDLEKSNSRPAYEASQDAQGNVTIGLKVPSKMPVLRGGVAARIPAEQWKRLPKRVQDFLLTSDLSPAT